MEPTTTIECHQEKKTQFLYFILLDPCNDKAAGNICLICSLAHWKAPGDISAGDLLERCRMKLPPGLLGRRPAPQLAWVRIASTPYTDDWRAYWGGGRPRLSCVTCTACEEFQGEISFIARSPVITFCLHWCGISAVTGEKHAATSGLLSDALEMLDNS